MTEVPAQPADFGVVVLNYNDHESSVTCVHSLIACDPAPRKIIVVDNESPNGSLSILQSALGSLPTVEVIGSGFNGGYSFGNNVGIRRLRAEGFLHVVIATSDTIVESPDPQAAAIMAIVNRRTTKRRIFVWTICVGFWFPFTS